MPHRCLSRCTPLTNAEHSSLFRASRIVHCSLLHSNIVIPSIHQWSKDRRWLSRTGQVGMSQHRPERCGRKRCGVRKVEPVQCADNLDAYIPDRAASRRRRAVQIQRILFFAGPALAIPLLDPLMDFFDSIFIGQCAGPIQLAALGPNNVIFNAFQYTLNALSVATLSVMANNLLSGNEAGAADILSAAIFVAAIAGVAGFVLLLVSGTSLIAKTGAAPELLQPAWEYMRIRAFGLPAILCVAVCQAGLLAQKDPWTAFWVVCVQTSIKLAGNTVMVAGWGLGLTGAAIATTAAYWAGLFSVLFALRRKQVSPRWHLPSFNNLAALGATFGPASLLRVTKSFIYMLVQTITTTLPTLQLAAHQPIYGLWSLCCFCHSPLEQAALAFLPGAKSGEELRETVGVLLGLAVVVGCVTAAAAAILPMQFPALLARDASLWAPMQSILPQAMLSLLFCSLEVASAGILIARQQIGYLVGAMAASLAVMFAYCSAVRAFNWGLPGVWWGLVLFFAVRAVQSSARVVDVVFGARGASHELKQS